MGSPSTETGRFPDEQLHLRRIGRTFAIAAKPVTVKQFLQFSEVEFGYDKRYTPTEDCPVHPTSWHMAIAYCNWLSDHEGIPKEEWCYETNPQGQVTKLKKSYLSLTGYRLPTEAEWEYACRAGAVTSRYYGESEELLGKYGWFVKNAEDRTWPVGSKKPNDLGLFDMHGNVQTWCQDIHKDYPRPKENKPSEDKEDRLEIGYDRMQRAGWFQAQASRVRSAFRYSWLAPHFLFNGVGFRVARTLH